MLQSHRRRSFARLTAGALAAAALAACVSKVDSTNPYDPGTPSGQKARASVIGKIASPALTGAINVEVSLTTNNRPFAVQNTSADGSFVFSSLAPGAYALQAAPDGFVPVALPLTLLAGQDVDLGDVVLTLQTGEKLSTLQGVATLGSSADSSGILVQVVEKPFSTSTDSSGHWSMAVNAGTYSVKFSRKDYLTAPPVAVSVQAGVTMTMDPVGLLLNPAKVVGHVDAERPAGGVGPLDDASVSFDSTALTGHTGGAQGAGNFTLTNIPAGSYVLHAAAPGYDDDRQTVLNLIGGELRTLATPLLLKLSRGGIAGTVTLSDAPGNAGGITVQLSGGPSVGSAVTGPDGKYAFSGLLAGVYTVTASRAGYMPLTVAPAAQVDGSKVKLLPDGALLPDPATILGSVTAENAAGGSDPVQNATVSLDGAGGSTQTNVGGDFALAVPVGSYVARVHLAGYADDTQAVLNLEGGERRTLATAFHLTYLRGAISGTVKLPDTGDASGIVVELTGTPHALVTGTDGTFRFDALIPGLYQVTARKDGYQRKVLAAAAQVAGTGVTHLPAATLDKSGGAVSVPPYTRLLQVPVTLNAPKADSYLISEDPNFTDPSLGDVNGSSTPRAFAGIGTASFGLHGADGQHSIYVLFLAAGVPAPVSSAQTVLDQQAPVSPSVQINSGSGFTNSVLVSLSLSALDTPAVAGAAVSGVGAMQIANDAVSVLTAIPVPFNRTQTWTLDTPGAQGSKTVCALFIDNAGNASAPACTTVVFDSIAPSGASLAASGAAPSAPHFTASSIVTVALGATDTNAGPSNVNLLVRLSNAPGFAGATYQPFQPSLTWLLPPGDGQKTIYAQFLDPAGNASVVVSDTITLDTTAPAAPKIAIIENDSRPSNGFTNSLSAQVDLSIAPEPGAASVTAQVSEDPSFNGAAGVVIPSGFTTRKPFTLGGTGTRTVYARFLDQAGNASATATASVVVDQTAPDASVLPRLSPAGATNGTAVVLTAPAAGQDEVQISGAGVSFTAPAPFVPAPAGALIPFTLSPGEGTKAISVVWRDLADNVSGPVALSLVYDHTAPLQRPVTITGALADGTASTTTAASSAVTLDLSTQADALSGIVAMKISNTPGLADVNWQPYLPIAKYPWTLASGGDGLKTVYVALQDAAGNDSVASPSSGTITLNTKATLSGTVSFEGAGADLSGTQASLAGTAITGTAAANGSYQLTNIPFGTQTLLFARAGFDTQQFQVTLAPGQALTFFSVTLAASRGSVSGSVTATGAADQTGTVVTISGGPDTASTVTDGLGNYRIDRLRAGTGYAATFSRPAYAKVTSSAFTVTSGGLAAVAPATLSLATTGSLAGTATVARPAGQNAGIAVSLTGVDVNGASVVGSTNTVASGAWSITGLKQGTYAVAFSKAAYDPQALSGIAVGAGVVTAPSVTLGVSSGTIAGSVALTAGTVPGFNVGADFSGAVVTLSGTDVPVPAAVTDASGKYQFTGVPVSLAGAQFTATASKPFFANASTSVLGIANTTVTVAATLSLAVSAGSLSGSALLFDNVGGAGNNATSAGVIISVSGTAFNGSAFTATPTTNAAGAWSVPALPPGSYGAVATSNNRTCAAYASATVSAGGAIGLGSIQCADALAPGALALGAPQVPATAQPGFTTGATIVVPITSAATDATAPQSNFRGYQLTVGDAPNWSGAPITAGQPATLTFSGLVANARNVLWARAVDWSGNAGPAASAVVTTDTVAPPAPVITTPRTVVNATTTSVTLTGSDRDTNFFGYQYFVTSTSATSTCPAGAAGAFVATSQSFAVSLTANLQTCLYAQAVDKAGNASPTTVLGLVSDLTPPSPPGFAPNYDPYKMSVRTPYVDFFNTAPATDQPGPGGAWQGVAWIEVDTGSGYQALCPQAACQSGGGWSPCSCGCTDARLRCDGGNFVGVRAALTEGTSTTVAFRAVDLAGNTGPGVSQQVLADATGDVVSAVSGGSLYPSVKGTLIGYEAGNFSGWLLDLGANRRVDASDARCQLSGAVATGLARSVVPIHQGLVGWADYGSLYIRRPGPDGLWCTGDDVTTTVRGGIANTYFDGLAGSGEKLVWTERNSVTQKYPLVVGEPGADGLVGTGDDVRTTIANPDGVGALSMGRNTVLAQIATCGPNCSTYFWRVYNATSTGAGTFAAGSTSFDPATNTGDVALSSDGQTLAWTEANNVLVVRQAGADGRFSAAGDDVTVRVTAPWAINGNAGCAVDGLHIVVTTYGSPNYLTHWSAGPDGVWGTADDVLEQTHPIGVTRQHPSLSDGLVAFQAGSDILDVDLTAFRWEVAPTSILDNGWYPLAPNGAGTLFYKLGTGASTLVARTAAGTETSTPSVRAFAADPTQAVAWDGSGNVFVYQPDASGVYFTAGAPAPVRLYSTANYLPGLSLGGGKAITIEWAGAFARYKIFDPGPGNTLKNGAAAFDPLPAGENLNYATVPSITAKQAFFTCSGNNTNTCVYGAGADGKFGTADDVASTNLVHPPGSARAGIPFNSASLAVSGTRMLISEPTPAGLYLIDAGPDGLFNTADDRERKIASIYLYNGQMSVAGNWAAYQDLGGAGGQQVYLISGFDGPAYLLSNYYSPKRAPVVDPGGRVSWIDGIFTPEGIMLRTP